MSNINFDNVYLLLIAVPLIVLFTIGFALVTRKENVNGHSIASYILHILMAVIIAFAAAGTTITAMLTETNVYVVADMSYSANKSVDAIDGYIRNMKLPRNSKLGVVCFGKDVEVVSEMGDPKNVKSVKNSHVDGSETNIAEALEYTGELFKESVIKRIVLITDGRQTDENDSYAINRAVDSLQAKGIKVDAIYIDSNLKEGSKEIQISGVEYTRTAFLNGSETANVSVQSSYETDAVLTLYLNNEKLRDRAVHILKGENTVTFDLITARSGVFDYEVRVEAEGDESSYNNYYLFTQNVSDDLKILAITQNWNDVETVVESYGAKASIEIYEYDSSVALVQKNKYINQYAGNGKINIHTLNRDIPFTIEQLCRYDEIVLADIDLSIMYNYGEFITNLDRVVTVFGKSLVTMGDLSIQNSSDTALRQLENMLPVSYGGNDETKIYTLIVDSSRSMDKLYHMDVAKQLCARLIDLLNDEDYICIVTFNGVATMVRELRPLTSRADVIDAINKLDVRQGTVIGAGLEAAYSHISQSTIGANKQVMLITDGLTYDDGNDNSREIVQAMYNEGIVTSVFDVGRQGDNKDGSNSDFTAQAAKKLLEDLAASGHGKYYYSNNAESLDDVTFAKVSSTVTVSTVEKETSVNAARRWDYVLDGIDTSAIPDVSGYVYSNIKTSATNVLTVNHDKGTGTTPKPLYAYWSYGNGKVATFTSQMNGKWIANWTEAGILSDFIENVFTTSTPVLKSDAPVTVDIRREGKRAYVEVVPAVAHLNTTATIDIIKPSGETIKEKLSFNSSYFYFEFDADEIGKYTVTVAYNYYQKDYLTDATFNISYAPEYNSFATFDVASLHKALDGRGTVVDNANITIENDASEISTYNAQLSVPLMIVAVAMLVVDIVVRKLKWNDIKSFFGSFRKKSKKQEARK